MGPRMSIMNGISLRGGHHQLNLLQVFKENLVHNLHQAHQERYERDLYQYLFHHFVVHVHENLYQCITVSSIMNNAKPWIRCTLTVNPLLHQLIYNYYHGLAECSKFWCKPTMQNEYSKKSRNADMMYFSFISHS